MASVDSVVVVVVAAAAAATVVGEVLVAAAAVADGGVAAVDDFESSGAVAASVEACKLEWLVGRRRLAVMNKLLLLLDCLHSPSYGPVDWKFDWMTLESERKNSAPCGILGNRDLTIPNCWSALSARRMTAWWIEAAVGTNNHPQYLSAPLQRPES